MLHLVLREEFVLHDNFADRTARVICFFGEHSGVFITDMRQESRDNTDTAIEPFLALLFVRLEVEEQFVNERVDL